MSSAVSVEHVAVFEREWAKPGNTPVDFPAVDVNKVLRERYELDEELVFTREMLWDMEVRKASHPDAFITSVVKPGSVEKWDVGTEGDFVRVSEQRLWLDRDQFGLVLELVHLDHEKQSVHFIGVPEVETPDGRKLTAGTGQPLFHVEHSVAGTENEPLNLWRVVNLTERPDPALLAHFTEFGKVPWLRDFIENYIRDTLGRKLTRKSAA